MNNAEIAREIRGYQARREIDGRGTPPLEEILAVEDRITIFRGPISGHRVDELEKMFFADIIDPEKDVRRPRDRYIAAGFTALWKYEDAQDPDEHFPIMAVHVGNGITLGGSRGFLSYRRAYESKQHPGSSIWQMLKSPIKMWWKEKEYFQWAGSSDQELPHDVVALGFSAQRRIMPDRYY